MQLKMKGVKVHIRALTLQHVFYTLQFYFKCLWIKNQERPVFSHIATTIDNAAKMSGRQENLSNKS